MTYIVDIIILVLLILFLIFGAKRGLLRSLGEFVASIAAAFLSSYLGGLTAKIIYEKFFQEGVTQQITDAISKGTTGTSAYFDSLPGFINSWLKSNGVTAESIDAQIATGKTSVADAIEEAVSPVLISLIKVFAVIVLFLLLMIILRFVVRLLSGIVQLPVLRQVDTVLGAVFGVLCGFMIIWVVLGAILYFKPMLSSGVSGSLDKLVSNSLVCNFVVNNNPISWIFD